MKTIGYSEASQVFVEPNKIYKVYNNIDLSGNTLTLPSGCTLDFQGGVIGNGTVSGNTTCIKTGLTQIFSTDIILSGTWDVVEAYPEWFGAKGDGTTDDTVAIQKTINFGKNVSFRKCVYMVTNLNITANNTIYKGNDAELKLKEYTQDSILFLQDCNNVVLENFVINGNNEALGGVEASNHNIRILGGYNIYLNNIISKYAICDGLYIRQSVHTVGGTEILTGESLHLNNVKCEYNYRQGMSVISWDNLIAINCEFNNTGKSSAGGTAPKAGVDFEPNYNYESCINANFVNCKFLNNVTGLTCNGHVENITLQNCVFKDNDGRAIIPARYGNTVVENCYFEGCGPVINNSRNYESRIVLKNLNIKDCGILIGRNGGPVIISNCVIKDCQAPVISTGTGSNNRGDFTIEDIDIYNTHNQAGLTAEDNNYCIAVTIGDCRMRNIRMIKDDTAKYSVVDGGIVFASATNDVWIDCSDAINLTTPYRYLSRATKTYNIKINGVIQTV